MCNLPSRVIKSATISGNYSFPGFWLLDYWNIHNTYIYAFKCKDINCTQIKHKKIIGWNWHFFYWTSHIALCWNWYLKKVKNLIININITTKWKNQCYQSIIRVVKNIFWCCFLHKESWTVWIFYRFFLKLVLKNYFESQTVFLWNFCDQMFVELFQHKVSVSHSFFVCRERLM